MLDRGSRKTRVGKVVSDKMDKTIVIAVQRAFRHPLYERVVRRSKKYKVHDQENECCVGDTVEIVETRPLSKQKHWRLSRIMEKAK